MQGTEGYNQKENWPEEEKHNQQENSYEESRKKSFSDKDNKLDPKDNSIEGGNAPNKEKIKKHCHKDHDHEHDDVEMNSEDEH